MKKKFKKTLRSNTHPIKPKMVITSKKDKLNTRRAGKLNLRKMIDKLGDLNVVKRHNQNILMPVRVINQDNQYHL